MLVTIDGAGASHEIIDHLTTEHGPRARPAGAAVEYSIEWPLDERTRTGIDALRESDWIEALRADGNLDPNAQ